MKFERLRDAFSVVTRGLIRDKNASGEERVRGEEEAWSRGESFLEVESSVLVINSFAGEGSEERGGGGGGASGATGGGGVGWGAQIVDQ